MTDQPGGGDSDFHELFNRYVLPSLATITALSFVAAASASIGVWRDVSVMSESMKTLLERAETQQKAVDELVKQVQGHEVRLGRGGL
jgi:hypothetical protein